MHVPPGDYDNRNGDYGDFSPARGLNLSGKPTNFEMMPFKPRAGLKSALRIGQGWEHVPRSSIPRSPADRRVLVPGSHPRLSRTQLEARIWAQEFDGERRDSAFASGWRDEVRCACVRGKAVTAYFARICFARPQSFHSQMHPYNVL